MLEIGIESHLSKMITEKRMKFYEEYVGIIEKLRGWIIRNGNPDSIEERKEYLDLWRNLFQKRLSANIWLSTDRDIPRLLEIEKKYFKLHKESALVDAYKDSKDSRQEKKRLQVIENIESIISNLADDEMYNNLLKDIRVLIGTDQIIDMQNNVIKKAQEDSKE